MGGAADNEQLIAVDIDLRQLPVLERILDGERVQPIELLEGVDIVDARISQPDPDELRPVGGQSTRSSIAISRTRRPWRYR